MRPSTARELLERIAATARPAGSAAEAEARDVCAGWLRDSGFEVVERPFTYSAFPGAWGTTIASGLLLVIATVAAAGISSGVWGVDRTLSLALVGVGIVAASGRWVARHGTRSVPFMRRGAVNLEARRGVPRIWLVAHLDSKSQPVSLLMRAGAAILLACAWAALLVAWAASKIAPVPPWVFVGLLGCTAVAAVALLCSWVGTAGHGALDNASGVATVLAAVRLLDLAIPVGVVVTSAEEFGLAGARAWVEGQPQGVAINCDGVDDRGIVTITAGGRARWLWRRLAAEAGLTRPGVRILRSLPGVLLDSAAFTDCGWAACTISRGTRASLARVHTRRDTLTRLSGSGILGASEMIASLAGAIIADGF